MAGGYFLWKVGYETKEDCTPNSRAGLDAFRLQRHHARLHWLYRTLWSRLFCGHGGCNGGGCWVPHYRVNRIAHRGFGSKGTWNRPHSCRAFCYSGIRRTGRTAGGVHRQIPHRRACLVLCTNRNHYGCGSNAGFAAGISTAEVSRPADTVCRRSQ